ncbi:hypothetical protein LOK49_LG06G02965 [Camellia lanceoleosa]|uniref:Uncharacterized protein n=1 Tax=Camellia lanceoleosa TaxID=1840588 RepID=A0ACC0HEE8_9ERIC|nr:hypothetical protein LOK49_LG06G02965 [Camellia lanceoleosa]
MGVIRLRFATVTALAFLLFASASVVTLNPTRQLGGGVKEEREDVVTQRRLSGGPGSSPPNCRSKCGRCGRKSNSPWTRSSERKRQDATNKRLANEVRYWLWEHSTIIAPKSAVAFPRFMKWDVGTLVSAARGVNLSGRGFPGECRTID